MALSTYIYIYILAMYRPRPEATANGYIDLTCARERTSCREQFVALNYFEPVPPATEVIGHFEEGVVVSRLPSRSSRCSIARA